MLWVDFLLLGAYEIVDVNLWLCSDRVINSTF